MGTTLHFRLMASQPCLSCGRERVVSRPLAPRCPFELDVDSQLFLVRNPFTADAVYPRPSRRSPATAARPTLPLDEKLQSLYSALIRRNGGETEFHQAVL